MEDCQILQPSVFMSVPRLWNKIYERIRGAFNEQTGCKRWLIEKGLSTKIAALNYTGDVTSGCYDGLVFGKVAKVLGGKVKLMGTGSAPMDKEVIDFLKVCFSCPMGEGYGLTETAAHGCRTDLKETILGHVGGPGEMIKMRLKDLPEMDYRSSDKPYPRGEICF